jgi:hypothetical protein
MYLILRTEIFGKMRSSEELQPYERLIEASVPRGHVAS